ncbi:MAG: FAD-dependent oxidoreductase [Candidatus Bathyarchaeota archaeon B26-2]|nr:MAG: FAD-dependent oxidoreductase [Candidatus Bathyarchaeota archaeon B26-2]
MPIRSEEEFEVVVVGGGPGGFSAAVSAARRGVSTLLLERYGFLGGMATAGLVNPFMSFHVEGKEIIRGVLREVVERLTEMGGYNPENRSFDPEIMKYVLDGMALEAGVELLYHTVFVDSETSEDSYIRGILVHNKSGLRFVTGKMFVDGTGDGDLAVSAGAPFEKGRVSDGLTQPMTLNFDLAAVDLGSLPSREELNEAYREAKMRGEITCPRENLLWFHTTRKGLIHFNTTRILKADGTNGKDLTEAEIEGRRQAFEIVNWLKKTFPAFKEAYIIRSGPQVGVRETRRIIGEYVLNAEDIIEARKFPDAICRGSYPIDIHNPTGEGTIIKRPPPGEYYEIPYRCLIPRGVENLLVASRCISATHEAHSAVRVMPIVMGVGQAAGTAAALCVKKGTTPRRLDPQDLRKALRESGAIV